MPSILETHNATDVRDVVHRTVEAIAAGKVVAVPTETVYGLAANALNEEAVDRLLAAKGRPVGQPLALAVKSVDDALDYVPDMSVIGTRLARRCWPGPITLVFEDHHPDSLTQQLPETVKKAVIPSKTVGLRVPDHHLLQAILRLNAGPLVLTSANKSGEPAAITADKVAEDLGDTIDLIVDDGPCRFAQASSVVQIHGQQVKLLREGVLTEEAIAKMSSFIVLIVCTGNTCRSPMAERLLAKRIADHLHCKPEDLADRGVMVMSAGIAAMPGGQPSQEAVQVLSDRGLNLQDHESQPLTDRLVRFADIILTMTHGHRTAIVGHWPEVEPRVKLLCQDASDVSDPIGGPVELYERCAQQIDQQLASWLQTWADEGLLNLDASGESR
ncbi:MAG TPA: threonylcarbamoyl-AMP synthase [Planctomycetaceae bacterium]|nr:threonylcarbamoyl-AMP synthase [Blastopirellula sp.]HAY82337.1 threonylcarbamoyl-AMP synthase [Planctomycetaceae bacterium]